MELEGDQAVIDLGSINTKSVVNLQVRDIRYINSLSSREMESLMALCDTFLPSVNIASSDRHLEAVTGADETFYFSSASMAGTPERVGGLICERLEHSKKWLIRLTLWMLSTRIGTFILCGSPSVSGRFPFFSSFAEISQKNKEQILLSWSLSFFYLLRMFFKAIKLFTMFVFFSQVDEKNENLAWKAIDYPGSDPEMKKLRLNKLEAENGKAEINGPLQEGLIHMNLPRDIVADSLRKSGLPVSVTRPYKKGSPSLRIRCDAVVVGSGSGGGVVAGVLAKAGYKVLVLEKGNYHARSNLSLLEGPTMDQMYQSGGLLATDDLGVVILAGSTVGGGSTINWSASIRTPQHVMDEWSEVHELELFGSKLYKEALDAVCEKMGVQSEISEEGFNNVVLRKGCKELGYPVNTIPRNSDAGHDCGWCCLGCKDGRKKGTCETWLLDFVNSGNGVILPGCEAIEVLRKPQGKGRKASASGVAFEFEYCKGVKELCMVDSKVTVVACGALNTPLLLKRSGLKNTNIGKHLHLHPVAMAWGHFPESAWPEQEKKSYKGGIMTAMSTVVADFDNTGYGAVIQTPSLHPGMFSSLQPWLSGYDIKLRMSRFSRTAHVFALARDKGSGTINSKTSISYKMDSADEKNLQNGIEKILRILTAAGADEIGTHHCKGKTLKVKMASNDEFERFVKEESERPLRDLRGQICSAHQMGSCRMGVDPKESVVGERGETWEMEGLFVADTSVFPTALGVNPMVTVQAIAYCTAQSVLDTLRRKKT